MNDWGTTPNGVFGAKLMWVHVDDPAALVPGARYVWVRRSDTVRQAISLWRAMQTQSWRDEGAEDGRAHAVYCFSAPRHLVDMLTEHDAAWARFLSGAVLALTYEEVASDLPHALERTLAHLGVPRPRGWPPALPAMRRQADEPSEQWAAAYDRDDGPTKDELIAMGWPSWDPEREQLYHLGFDPNEMRNLIGDPRWSDVAGDLRARLDRLMHETEDPLLDGPVPLPEGAWVNTPDQVSAAEAPAMLGRR